MLYQKLIKYPHMKPADVAIWERFIDKNPGVYFSVEYDVAVGSGYSVPREYPDAMKKDFKILGQKKIDVVGHTTREIHVIEIKPAAGPSAIGQVLGYIVLYRNFFPTDKIIKPILITDQITPDLPLLAHETGVQLIVV